LKTAPTKPDFSLNIDAISSAINEKTKAVLIDSPNNPTGQVYSEQSLSELGTLLKEKSRSLSRTIYLISDEPYRNTGKLSMTALMCQAYFPATTKL
jgi:aspartate aminotransferase